PIIMRIIKYIFITLILISQLVIAQRTSTYTRYGLGDVYYSYSARSLSLGHAGTALINSDYIGLLNPASWSNLSKTRIEFSFAYDELKLSNQFESKYYGDGVFKGFMFAFPVSKVYGIGVAMGIVPYTRVNYEVREMVSNEASGNYTSTYQGKGGLSKVFVGGSYQLPIDFILGATLEYYFGNITYNSKVEFENTALFPAEYELDYGPTGFGTTVGFITPDMSGLINSGSVSNLRLGLSANLISKLDTDTSLISRSSTIIDSIGIGKTKMKVPMRLNAGLHIAFVNVYNIMLDYFYQPWSEFRLSDVNQLNMNDVHKISLGFEYRPQKAPGVSFWEQIMLRAGLSYELSQYKINGIELKQYSFFGGFAIPLSDDGKAEQNLLEEQFLRINLGLSFGELWFIRYEK
ncbi:MAG: hypothetical protein P8X47_13680, partial [Ignavibacteriaceae bacterium]